MCGIFAYAGVSQASRVVLDGLKRLEYRGYDSWGLGIGDEGSVRVVKGVGEVPRAKTIRSWGKIAIGHTRWATHGRVTKRNAHPHTPRDRSFALVHNGIVENYEAIKRDLIAQGYDFRSETDTEVIVGLIHRFREEGLPIVKAVRKAFLQLEGRNTVVVLAGDGKVIGLRNGSPLVAGLSSAGEIFLSSDTLSLAPVANRVLILENGEMVVVGAGSYQLMKLSDGSRFSRSPERLMIAQADIGLSGFDHYMIKEIFEAPDVILQAASTPTRQVKRLATAILDSRRVATVGSGTAGLAAAQIAYYLRVNGGILAESLIGAEAQSYLPLLGEGDLLIVPSQSGETADVLEVLEAAKKKGVKIAAYVNMPGSMMERLADYFFSARAGPEICVMSTKVFVSQIAWGYLVAAAVAGRLSSARTYLRKAAGVLRDYLASAENLSAIRRLSLRLCSEMNIFLLGKSQNLEIAREGMVKIIEGSYRHAHAIPAGDLKHYAITLMEKGVPVVVIVSDDQVQKDVILAASEVKARGATVIGISPQNNEVFDIHLSVPSLKDLSALINVVVLQLLAYYLAVSLGHNVDKPRHIAKSVTVK